MDCHHAACRRNGFHDLAKIIIDQAYGIKVGHIYLE
jgi:hypothetical protein